MADISLTAANIVPSTRAVRVPGTAGATIAAGQLVYKDASDSNKWKLADGNSATAAVRAVEGIAVNSASAGQPITIVTSDPDLAVGTHGVTIGEPLFLSNTPGGIMPYADLASGNYTAHVAQAKTSTTISFAVHAPAVAHG